MSSFRIKIYGLSDPDSGDVRYIGKTEMRLSQRLSTHIRSAKVGRDSSPKGEWIKGLLDSDKRPVPILIWEGESPDWQEKEREVIASWRDSGADLLNVTDGGNGSYSGTSGIPVDDELISMLGKVADGRIAKAFGVTRKAIAYHRTKLGIPQYVGRTNHKPPPDMGGHNKIPFTEDQISMMGGMSDARLAKIAGCSKYAVARQRKALGIKSYAESTGNNGRFDGTGSHPRWGTQMKEDSPGNAKPS